MANMHSSPREILQRFYLQALTVNADTTPQAVLEEVLADDFQSINSQETKDKATLIRQIAAIWAVVPDLKFEPQDKLMDGSKVVIRSVASGTPKGNFMGMVCDGGKSFRIDTIDIHELADGRIWRVHHVEDWASALRQLKE
ncbi:ester cyclase [uncultured Aquitalea sp.]|uniref:ester cyclase n=1 Tax=uncultured Aquitalea sp. TaxID=540272 RepID=UPI0025D9FAE4|nr:ester cyclase [uncultured Aquitalea sp.]